MPIEIQTCSTQNVLFMIPDLSCSFVFVVVLMTNGSTYKFNNYYTKAF